jgi:hypothetical protein
VYLYTRLVVLIYFNIFNVKGATGIEVAGVTTGLNRHVDSRHWSPVNYFDDKENIYIVSLV